MRELYKKEGKHMADVSIVKCESYVPEVCARALG